MRSIAIALAAALLAQGCSSEEGPIQGTRARFDLAALSSPAGDFFGIPFPNDLRRTSKGLNLAGFPNPKRSSFLKTLVVALHDAAPGFGASSPMFVSFSGPIDPSSLPADPAASTEEHSPVQVVDIDSAGGTEGERVPLQLKWFGDSTMFLPANTLAVLPLYGAPLAPGHRYALVITDTLLDTQGKPVVADEAMRRALGLWSRRPETEQAAAVTAPFVEAAAAIHIDLKRVALASVFTVQDATGPMAALRRAVHATAAPAPERIAYTSSGASHHLFEGLFPVPNFQTGAPPYADQGGAFVFADDGTPLVQRTESVRFALSLPKGPPPAGGFPVVLYAHGTGGSYRSFVLEGLADNFAGIGAAVLSMDQVLHGPRNPSCTEGDPSYGTCVASAFFNFVNPFAGRDNARQGAADLFQLLRLAQGLSVPASMHPEKLDAALDSSRLAFMGHSQGGITGTPFAAAEPEIRAAVLSGTGGVLSITVLQRKDPLDFKALGETLMGIDGVEPLEPFHPGLALVQTLVEPADPINYGRHLVKQPLDGVSRHVMLTEGLLDPYTPADTSEALAAAAGLDIGGTAFHLGPAFVFRGLRVLPLPLQQNAEAPGGPKTAVLLQYPKDGHYPVFDNPVARCRYLGFIQSALSTGIARVDPCGG